VKSHVIFATGLDLAGCYLAMRGA